MESQTHQAEENVFFTNVATLGSGTFSHSKQKLIHVKQICQPYGTSCDEIEKVLSGEEEPNPQKVIFGEYLIQMHKGSGATSEVYRVLDIKTKNNLLVLKIFKLNGLK